MIVYVTFDGILSGLGYSQVLRLVTSLAARGPRYTLVSLERPSDLADSRRVDAARRRLAAVDVPWTALPYAEGGGGRAVGRNVASATRAVLALVARGGVRLVHARGYQAGIVASAAHVLARTPYLFDARGYWVDEQREEGRRFRARTSLAAARAIERRLYDRAAAVVTLTDLQRDDLRERAWTRATTPVVTVPTCADFDDFALRHRDTACEGLPGDARDALRGRLVLGIVGSVNRSYLADRAAELVARVVRTRDDARVVVVAADRDAHAAILGAAGVPVDRVTYATATHDQMPRWLAAMDWTPTLLATNFAKRASMPTRLAEIFAVGVRPVHHGCNREVAEWVRRVGTGIVLERTDDASLEDAANVIAGSVYDEATLARGRETARGHFSLEAGVARYLTLLSELGAS